jgi:hypothetical protein
MRGVRVKMKAIDMSIGVRLEVIVKVNGSEKRGLR